MKRLSFKSEFVPAILDGTKTGTARWAYLPLLVGDVVSGVTRKGKTPAFLVPASEGFARLRITKTEAMLWKDFGPEHLAATTVDREWYLRENPHAHDLSRIFYYEFEVTESGSTYCSERFGGKE